MKQISYCQLIRSHALSKIIPWPKTRWNRSHLEHHKHLITAVLDGQAMSHIFKRGDRLPGNLGVAFDERVVEYGWLFAQQPSGLMLDAGSTLNHRYILERIRPHLDGLHIATLVPESVAYPELDVSYFFSDLRNLPIKDGFYDTVVSISTLEHVGMDNTHYGSNISRAEDPDHELQQAVTELKRVLAHRGTLFATVPYGKREDHGWLRQFDHADLDMLIDAFGPSEHSITVYEYSRDGWQISDLESAANASYSNPLARKRLDPDRAMAARAVACLRLKA